MMMTLPTEALVGFFNSNIRKMNSNEIIEDFKLLTQNIEHGTRTFFEHCKSVYDILKSQNLPEDVCLAGLYHAIYGTPSFHRNLQKAGINVTREYVRDKIGDFAEDLVYQFCRTPNRDINIYNSKNVYLQHISYANMLSQSREHEGLKRLKYLYEKKLNYYK
jgi:hypothetical protein